MQGFDVIVVGGGPAGAASALKCSQLGFKTLLIEKGVHNRHKPCGGILPPICVDILNELKLRIPEDVMSSFPTLVLFYVPPSGRKNGGYLTNYRLLNVNRDRFDEWLRKAAESSGAQVLYKAEFLKFKTEEGIKVLVSIKGHVIGLSARYLIGADGTFSKVQRQLYPNLKMEVLMVLQEYWRARGDFDECFYAFFKGDVTPTYAYVIPKDELLVVGTGAPKGHSTAITTYIKRFKKWLQGEFAFNPISLERKEAAAVPYGSPINGEGDVILVGDAAGFCNHLSGEGIRLAIESGIAAGEAVRQAEHSDKALSRLYAMQVEGINEFVRRTHRFATSLTDERREDFVRSELARISLAL